jgi:hypothetical protein
LGDGFQACDLAVAENETCQVGQDDELWHDLIGHTAAVQPKTSEACQDQQGRRSALSRRAWRSCSSVRAVRGHKAKGKSRILVSAPLPCMYNHRQRSCVSEARAWLKPMCCCRIFVLITKLVRLVALRSARMPSASTESRIVTLRDWSNSTRSALMCRESHSSCPSALTVSGPFDM